MDKYASLYLIYILAPTDFVLSLLMTQMPSWFSE